MVLFTDRAVFGLYHNGANNQSVVPPTGESMMFKIIDYDNDELGITHALVNSQKCTQRLEYFCYNARTKFYYLNKL